MGGRLPLSDFSSALSCPALVQRYWEVWTRKTYSRNQGRFAFSSPTPCLVGSRQPLPPATNPSDNSSLHSVGSPGSFLLKSFILTENSRDMAYSGPIIGAPGSISIFEPGEDFYAN